MAIPWRSRWRAGIAVLPLFLLIAELGFGWGGQAGLSRETALTLIMMIWMVSWWIFEVLPLGITALLPIVFMPMTGVAGLHEITPSYANAVIFLFLGGFMLARGLEKTHLNERIALHILMITGRSDKGIVLGFVISTALLSMWISNTATAVMMLPIAISVIAFLRRHVSESEKADLKPFTVVVYLSIAYAANIGGIMTPIGTPPNVVFVGYLDELYHRRIDFWRWMLVAGPVSIALLAGQFILLNRLFRYRLNVGKDFRRFATGKVKELGSMTSEQKVMLAVFSLTCLLWMMKDLIHLAAPVAFLNDTSIAILGGALLFLIPTQVRKPKPVLDARDISTLPWNIVLLFGGGIALAGSLERAGLIQVLTSYFAQFDLGSAYLLIFVMAVLILALTEIMSNVALCVVALPVLMKLGEAQGLDPVLIAFPATLASSMAFSMPISTPPNAIVFGTNEIRIQDMIKAGVVLNISGILLIMTLGWLLMRLF